MPSLRRPFATSTLFMILLLALGARAETGCVPLTEMPLDDHGVFDRLPATAAPELDGDLRIGRITTERLQIFDLDDPQEDNWLFRLANRFHILTREQTLLEQLQFASGEGYDATALNETERILRERVWLYDARVVPVQRCNDSVDVKVVTRDVWSLVGTGDLDRAGGDTSVAVGIQETNLFGRGERLGVLYTDGVDRSGPGFFFIDDYLAGGPLALVVRGNKHSDGGRLLLDVQRPFRSLDDRLSYGAELLFDQRDQPLFAAGERVARFEQRHIRLRSFVAASNGRQEGAVQRWTLGVEFEDLSFDRASGPLQPARIADDRRRSWPFVRYEYIEDDFDSSLRLDFLLRPQDIYQGLRYGVTLGYAPNALGADASRLMVRADLRNAHRPAPGWFVAWRTDLDATIRSGDTAENLVTRAGVEAHFRHHEQFGFFASLEGVYTRNLTEDRQLLLGGDTGLRGYPSRFQNGDRSVLLRLEERWFSSANPFRVLLVGAAVFVDAGRAWFPGDANDDTTGWLTNVGVGLRLGSNRGSGRNLFHIDVAVPLRTGGPDVDDFLVGLTIRETF
ncbi:MAG: BamA/TamA family outer membrane protein [Gammaproteobacteria bacterium]|nr:BamA/TamA family outer membrane protein [Gammaproteobacteria bacterium]